MSTPSTAVKKRPSFFLFVGIIITICFVCIGISFAMDAMGLLPESTPTSIPSSTPFPSETPPPTITPLPVNQLQSLIETSLGTGNRDLARLTIFDWSETDQSLIIQWTINDNFSSNLIMVGIQTDITDMLKVISQSGLLNNYQFVTFVGTFPLRDAFGNVSEERVITASYNKTTTDKINWENFLYTDIFIIADLYNIHPAMTNP